MSEAIQEALGAMGLEFPEVREGAAGEILEQEKDQAY